MKYENLFNAMQMTAKVLLFSQLKVFPIFKYTSKYILYLCCQFCWYDLKAG